MKKFLEDLATQRQDRKSARAHRRAARFAARCARREREQAWESALINAQVAGALGGLRARAAHEGVPVSALKTSAFHASYDL